MACLTARALLLFGYVEGVRFTGTVADPMDSLDLLDQTDLSRRHERDPFTVIPKTSSELRLSGHGRFPDLYLHLRSAESIIFKLPYLFQGGYAIVYGTVRIYL